MSTGRAGSSNGERVRYAVVGLGYIAQVAVLPAFKNAENSELAALVSGDGEKLSVLGRKYGVKSLHDYADYDRLLESGEVDAVYIALPNSQHREYTVRAAAAGRHILCEKPLALTVEECADMIDAAKANDVKLMTAYRLHFNPANLRAVELVRDGRLGEPRVFTSTFTMQVLDEDNIRLRRDLGGGPLYDIGIYCINAARYLFAGEPVEAMAVASNSGDERFREVEETVSATLRFPGERLAAFTVSFNGSDVATYSLVGTDGSLELESAYEYVEEMRLRVTVGDRKQEKTFPKQDQFGPEFLEFSRCIQDDRKPEASGEEGLADVRVIQALHESIRAGAPVALTPFDKRVRPGPEQALKRPAVKKPELVHAEPPSGGR